LTVALLLVACESALISPYYLAFFNVLVGGPDNGPRYLADSNIDWGQDILRLKTYLDRRHERSVCLGYFGNALPEYYGIDAHAVPSTEDVRRDGLPNCLTAVSVTPLMGAYVNDDWAWLRKEHPVAKIGYSIYVYDFRGIVSRSPSTR